MSEEAKSKIDELRKKIDSIDCQLVEKLNARAELALEIRALKSDNGLPLYDPGREEEIFQKITSVNNGPLYDDDLRGIYEIILHAMKSLD
ncbi:MAG: chorismate mutase [Actinobacteria bacterium]|nr:chorismate mutase [Actinomycetota bacterium]